MSSFTHALAKRNIRIMFWVTLFGAVNFLEPILTLFYLARGLEQSDVFGLTIAWSLTILICEVPTGLFADRFGPKASFITGGLIAIASKLCLLFAHDVWMFYLYSVLLGLYVTFFSGAEEALIYESLKETGDEERMGDVMGKMNSAVLYPTILAGLFGAYWAQDLQESQFVTLILLGFVFQLVQVFLLFKIHNPSHLDNERDNPFQHVRNGVEIIRSNPALFRLFLNFTIVFVASFVVTMRVEQPYFQAAGIPVAWLGAMYAGGKVLQLLLSRRIGWFQARFQPVTLMWVTGVTTLGGTVLATFVQDRAWAAAVVFLILRLSHTVRSPIYSQLSNEYIPSGSRATTLSLLSILDAMADVVLLLAFAGIADLGFTAVYGGVSVIVLIGLLIPIRRKQR